VTRPFAVLGLLGALALAHELLAAALDRAELVELLLSPSLDALVALPLALLLYALRLGLLFLGPGIALLALAAIARRAVVRDAPPS
jgi:hypothetical protein